MQHGKNQLTSRLEYFRILITNHCADVLKFLRYDRMRCLVLARVRLSFVLVLEYTGSGRIQLAKYRLEELSTRRRCTLNWDLV